MKKLVSVFLMLLGTSLLFGAFYLWISQTYPQQTGVILSVAAIFSFLLGAGENISGWIDLIGKDKASPESKLINDSYNYNVIRNIITNKSLQTQSYEVKGHLHQLPPPPADFIGREKELRLLRKTASRGTLISGIKGLGGIGKTALGLMFAKELAIEYPDGQIFLDLRGAGVQSSVTPAEAMKHVIRSFFPNEVGEEKSNLEKIYNNGFLTAKYQSVLHNKRVLLFFDNAKNSEQLIPLLPPPTCFMLITTRQHFEIPGFWGLSLEELSPLEARMLVRKIIPGIAIQDAENIANKCGYHSLAIRVATSMLKVRNDLTVNTLLTLLSNNQERLGLIEGSLAISYGALDDITKKRLRLCAYKEDLSIDEIRKVWGIEHATPLFVKILFFREGFKYLLATTILASVLFYLSSLFVASNQFFVFLFFLYIIAVFSVNIMKRIIEKYYFKTKVLDTVDTLRSLGELQYRSLITYDKSNNVYKIHDLTRLYAQKLISSHPIEKHIARSY